MVTTNKCTICGDNGIPGLVHGHGKCQYHYNVGQFGQAWADKCRADDAARQMLAALKMANEAMSHHNGYHQSTTGIKIRAAIAAAEAAGIKAE